MFWCHFLQLHSPQQGQVIWSLKRTQYGDQHQSFVHHGFPCFPEDVDDSSDQKDQKDCQEVAGKDFVHHGTLYAHGADNYKW